MYALSKIAPLHHLLRFNAEPNDFQKCWRTTLRFSFHSSTSSTPMPLSSAQSLFQLFSAYCPRPALKCCSFIFVFICQISKTQVPLRATPQNIKLESRPNPSRSIDKGWQAYLMECSVCPRLGCLLFHLAVFNRPWGHEKYSWKSLWLYGRRPRTPPASCDKQQRLASL